MTARTMRRARFGRVGTTRKAHASVRPGPRHWTGAPSRPVFPRSLHALLPRVAPPIDLSERATASGQGSRCSRLVVANETTRRRAPGSASPIGRPRPGKAEWLKPSRRTPLVCISSRCDEVLLLRTRSACQTAAAPRLGSCLRRVCGRRVSLSVEPGAPSLPRCRRGWGCRWRRAT